MIDFEAEIKQVSGELYKIALDYMDEEEARDFSFPSPSAGAGSGGFGRNPVPNPSPAIERKRLARMRGFKMELGRALTRDNLRRLEQSFRDRLNRITDKK
jgi:hypothetical protein